MIEKIDQLKWFHAIDFGDYISKGRMDNNVPPNYSLFGVYQFLEKIDVKEMTCLDVGAMSGIVSFILKQRGAPQVTATDLYKYDTFVLAREILGLDVEYRIGVRLKDLPTMFNKGHFDLIILAGVIYHIFSPLEAIAICRNLLKENGLMLVETVMAEGEEPKLMLNTEMEDPIAQEKGTYLVPTMSCLNGMMKFCAMDVLGSVKIAGAARRITFLGRACKPSEVANRTEQLRKTHEQAIVTHNLTFNTLEAGGPRSSAIRYTGESGHAVINIFHFNTTLPLQPRWLG